MKRKLKHIPEHELGTPALLTLLGCVDPTQKISKNFMPRKKETQDAFRQTKEAIPNSKL